MSDTTAPVDPHAEVSHVQDGRVLTGVGVSVDRLAETMDRHSEPAAAPETTETPADPAAPVSRGRQRFSELTRERDEAKAAREAAEKERDELKARVSQPAPASQPTPAPQPTPQTEPQTFSFPKYEAFVASVNPQASYDDWQDAKDEARYQWRVQHDLNQRLNDRFVQQQQAQTFQQALGTVQARGRTAYPDYDTVMQNGAGASIPIARDIVDANNRFQFLLQHPASEHLQYAIAKDATLANRLQNLSPFEFALEVAKLAPAPQEAPRSTYTPPPAPYAPVSSGSATVPPSSADLATKGNYEAYRSRRATERGVKPKYR